MQLTISTSYEVQDEDLQQLAADLITTAVEGGINYWATVDSYTHERPDTTAVILREGEEFVGPDRPRIEVTTGDVIDFIVGKVLTGKVETYKGGHDDTFGQRLADAFKAMSAGLPLDRTDLDYDADDADFVLQSIALGEVVYG